MWVYDFHICYVLHNFTILSLTSCVSFNPHTVTCMFCRILMPVKFLLQVKIWMLPFPNYMPELWRFHEDNVFHEIRVAKTGMSGNVPRSCSKLCFGLRVGVKLFADRGPHRCHANWKHCNYVLDWFQPVLAWPLFNVQFS